MGTSRGVRFVVVHSGYGGGYGGRRPVRVNRYYLEPTGGLTSEDAERKVRSVIIDTSVQGGQTLPGAVACADLRPLGPDGARIHGRSPVRSQLRLTGEDLSVPVPPLGAEPGEACFEAASPGSVELELWWGSASAQSTWTVL